MIKPLPLRGAEALEAFAIDDKIVITEAGFMTLRRFTNLRKRYRSVWRLKVPPPMATWHPVSKALTSTTWYVDGKSFKLIRRGVTWSVVSKDWPAVIRALKSKGFYTDSQHMLLNPPFEILNKLQTDFSL